VLIHRDVDAGYASHGVLAVESGKTKYGNGKFQRKTVLIALFNPRSTLTLLVARVRADHIDHAPAAHDLAVLADLLHRRPYFHGSYP
jgi:hypothetical protein